MAYDALRRERPDQADREYLGLLLLAARESEQGVDDALRLLLSGEEPITRAAVEALVRSGRVLPAATEIQVPAVNLALYNTLLSGVQNWGTA